jgi:glucokinase
MGNGNKDAAKADKKHWIGFDLGGTKMLAVVYDEKFEPLGRARKKTKGSEGMESGLKRINNTIADALEDAKIKPDDIAGLGIGCPGPLDLKKKTIREAPNLGWDNVPIGKSINREFGFPVEVANDVDAGVFGEYKFGAGKGHRCVAGIFPGTGIGGGCVYEGKLIRGANATCMEIGHIPIMTGGPRDGAGNAGSLEAMASRLSIAGAAALAAYRGDAKNLLKDAGTDVSNIRSGALAESVKNGDKSVQKIVEDACEYLGLSVVTMVHLLAPDVIVFGGGLIEAMPKLMLSNIEKVARKRVLPSLKDVFEIKEAKLGDDAGVMGAAALARQAFDKSSDY